MNADDCGQGIGGAFRIVDIQQIIIAKGTIGNISAFRDPLRKGNCGIPLLVAAGRAEIEQQAVKDMGVSSCDSFVYYTMSVG